MPSSHPVSPPNPELCRFLASSIGCVVALASTCSPAQAQSTPPAADAALPSAPAAPPSEVPAVTPVLLLVRTRDDAGVMSRLRSELEPSSYDLVEIRPDERRGALELRQIAEQQRVTAAIRFDAAQGTIELWVSRPGGAVSETISNEGARLSDWVLVLRTTEALRAHGLELGPEPSRSPAPPEPESPAAEVETPPMAGSSPAKLPHHGAEFGVALGVGADLSPGGVPSQSQLQAAIYLQPTTTWTAQAFAWYPVSRSDVSGPEGVAKVRTWLLGASVSAALLEQSKASFVLGAGYALLVHTMDGRAAAGYEGAEDRVVTSGPLMRADLRYQLASWLRLDVMTLMGLSLPELEVEFSGRSAARWGRPFVAVGVGFESALVNF